MTKTFRGCRKRLKTARLEVAKILLPLFLSYFLLVRVGLTDLEVENFAFLCSWNTKLCQPNPTCNCSQIRIIPNTVSRVRNRDINAFHRLSIRILLSTRAVECRIPYQYIPNVLILHHSLILQSRGLR